MVDAADEARGEHRAARRRSYAILGQTTRPSLRLGVSRLAVMSVRRWCGIIGIEHPRHLTGFGLLDEGTASSSVNALGYWIWDAIAVGENSSLPAVVPGRGRSGAVYERRTILIM